MTAPFGFADRIRGVLFDAGNTLLWLDHARMAALVGDVLGTEAVAAVRAAEMRARPRLDPYLRTAARREGATTSRLYAELIVDELGTAPGDERGRAAVEALLAVWRTLWVCPPEDAARTLDRLTARGLAVGCLSNSDGTVRTLLEDAGLAHRLRCVVDSGVEGVEKPDPRIFRIAAARLGVTPAACVYVGDFLSLDVEGARGAGMEGVLLDPADTWSGTAADDVPRVRSLTEFAERLE